MAEIWGIAVGDNLKIGEKVFAVKGIVLSDSSQGLRGFSLAPRIYLPLKDVEQTGLLKPGSTGSYARHFLIPRYLPEDFEILRNKLLSVLPDSAIKVTLPQESSEQSGRVMGYLTDFMSLAALIGLLLSQVGIFYLYQSHLVARLKDFCLFNLMGLNKASDPRAYSSNYCSSHYRLYSPSSSHRSCLQINRSHAFKHTWRRP